MSREVEKEEDVLKSVLSQLKIVSREVLELRKQQLSVDNKQEVKQVPSDLLECEICSYSCRRKSDLEKHVRAHAGSRTWKCEHCEMNFSSEKEVEEHRLSHQKVNQFECPKCDWSFVSLDNLKSHLEKRLKNKNAD